MLHSSASRPDLQGDQSAAAATAHAQRRRGNGGSAGKALQEYLESLGAAFIFS